MSNNSSDEFDFVDVAETETEPAPIVDQQQEPASASASAVASKKCGRRGLMHKDWVIFGLCLCIVLLSCGVAMLSRHVRELNQEVEELTGTVTRYRSHDAVPMNLLALFRPQLDEMASRLCGTKLFSRWC